MPFFETTRKLRNGWKYEIGAISFMSENNSSETNPIKSAKKINTDNESRACILIQKEVKEPVKNSVAPLTKQLEDLTRMIDDSEIVHCSLALPKGRCLYLF